MPTIVTASELRTILGVSSSLYSDAYLADIVDASENLVLTMLVTFQSKINKVSLENNVAYFHTATIATGQIKVAYYGYGAIAKKVAAGAYKWMVA